MDKSVLHLLQSFDLLPGRSGFRAVLQVLQVHRRMSCNNAWVWPIDGGQEALKGGRWALGRMGDGRWALGDEAASSCWSATTSGKRGKLGGQSALLPLQRWYIFFPPPSPDLPPFKQEGWPVARILATPGGGSKLRRPPDTTYFSNCIIKFLWLPTWKVCSTGHS